MKKYEVNYIDPETGAISPIDNIEAKDGYTAEDYVRDCEENADQEYVDMLHEGTVTLIEIEDEKDDVAVIGNTEVKLVKVMYKGETTTQNGIYIHDKDDEFNDGDCILIGYDALPETEKELSDWLTGDTAETTFELIEDGIYKII